MFAVIDIETTGGNPISERIIEIAIIVFDGKKIIEEYSTLVNPEKTISPFISTFTGITNKMVYDAPKIEAIKEVILKLTDGNIFVAHNAKFDYGFIKHELKALGIKFSRKTLDTVQLSRKTFPEFGSHSLGNICRDLGIQIDNRHRALGDARATLKLLERIIEKQNPSFLEELMTDDLLKLNLPKQLAPQKVEALPEETGIIYFYDKSQQVIAIESAKNIKEFVFKTYKETQQDRYKRLLHLETADIQVEVVGNELLSILLEDDYKQQYQPKYNKIQKYYEFTFGLFALNDEEGFKKLAVKMLDGAEEPILKFSSKLKAEKMLHQIINSSRLGPIFKKIDTKFHYNERMEAILAKYQYPYQSFYIILQGRIGTEKCAIRKKENNITGYTFYEPAYIQQIQELDKFLRPTKEFNNTKKNVITFIRKYEKYIQIIPA